MRHLVVTIIFVAFTLVCANAVSEQRSEADALRDKLSKPDAVLEFIGVQPGWQVMDMFAGNGYYSEILAAKVGAQGKVYLHNNQAYMGFSTKLSERIKDDRLPNVEVYAREVEDVNLPSDSLDMVLLVMAYHDAYFEQNSWTVKAAPLLKTVHRVLKPGGVLAVIDHHAKSGTGSEPAQDLHRIDVDFAKQDIQQYGFTLDAESDLLENDVDDLTLSVFDPIDTRQHVAFLIAFRGEKIVLPTLH